MTTIQTIPDTPETQIDFADLFRSFAAATVFIVMLAVVGVYQPSFLSGTGPTILLYQAIPILILALGQSAVIATGGIDLSNAALAVLSAVLLAKGLEPFGVAAPVGVILIASVAGSLNGWIVTRFQVPSFAVSLGALGVWQSLALLVTSEQTLYVSTGGEYIFWISDLQIFGIQALAYIGIGFALILSAVLYFTKYGRFLRAVGLNERAAILSGVPVKWTKIGAFALSGACSGLAGILLTAQQGTASASGLGVGLLLPAITASIVGGTAITGGILNPINIVIGSLIVALVPIASAVMGVDPKYQQIIFGAVVILSVAVTIDRQKLSVIK